MKKEAGNKFINDFDSLCLSEAGDGRIPKSEYPQDCGAGL